MEDLFIAPDKRSDIVLAMRDKEGYPLHIRIIGTVGSTPWLSMKNRHIAKGTDLQKRLFTL
jgi:hypothetical protein